MASVAFSPQGTQLDNDEIADIQVKVGDPLEFGFTLDTSGLDANLQSIKLRLEGDSTEVNLSDTLTDFFETTFPDVAVVEDNSNGDFTSVVVELKGEPGAVPNTTNVLVESEATILDGLANDGTTDIGVTVVEAIDVNGTDVTEKFVPSQQTIDLQPLPTVQAIFGTEQSDPIIGTSQDDLIEGKEGNDLIIDNEGNDRSFGEEGSDLFIDDVGNDTIVGGADNDFVNIDSDSGGDDTINLGLGNDLAFGGTGTDTFVLNRDSGVTGIGDFTAGEDRFALGENLTKEDLSFAQLDNDNLGSLNGSTVITDANTGKVIAFVNAAAIEAVSNAEFVNVEDVLPADNSPTTGEESPEPIQVELPPAQSGEIFGTPNPDVLVGDDGNNLILAGDDNNFVNAGVGDDRVFGGNGTNIFNGEAGNDLLNGGVDENVLNGGDGDDTLLGGIGSGIFNVLNGDNGNDVIVGGSDGNAIGGGQGDDLLFGGAGNSGLVGNEGHDTFAFASGEGADIVFDFEPGEDAIALTSGSSYDSLQIEYNTEGNYTNISEETGELITTLIGVEADQLAESNFTTI
jgi:Ca2+-binding RTX toxin-like protein